MSICKLNNSLISEIYYCDIRMEDRDSALAIIQKFNGFQLPGASLPLQVRFADSLEQKKLKGQTAKRRMWRTRGEYASLGGVSIF